MSEFSRNILANIVSHIIIITATAVGGAAMGLVALLTSGLGLVEKSVIAALFGMLLVALGAALYATDNYKRQLTAKLGGTTFVPQNVPSDRQLSIAPFHGEKTGIRLESAMFGAPGHTPIDVFDKVKTRFDSGDPVPVSWQFLLGKDPREYVTKYLTITLSITERESKEIFLPPSGATLPIPTVELGEADIVRITVIEGAVAERPRGDESGMPLIDVRLRIRVFATEQNTKLDSWRLELRFGGESYCAMDLAYDKVTFWTIPDSVSHSPMPMPLPPTNTEPRIEEISRREPLPVNSDLEGWIGFKTTDTRVRLDDVLGCDFSLSAYAKGKLCKVTVRPGPWRKRVRIS